MKRRISRHCGVDEDLGYYCIVRGRKIREQGKEVKDIRFKKETFKRRLAVC